MATLSDKISPGHQPNRLRDTVQHTFSASTTGSFSNDRGRETAALKQHNWLATDSVSKYSKVKPNTSYVHLNSTPHSTVLTCQYIFSPPVVQALVKASWSFVVVVLSSKNSPILKLESTVLRVPSFQEGVHCCSPERENVLPSAEYSDATEAIRVCNAIQNKK